MTEACKIAKLNDLYEARIDGLETHESFVQSEKIDGWSCYTESIVEGDFVQVPASLGSRPGLGIINEYAPHERRRKGEELCTILPGDGALLCEA